MNNKVKLEFTEEQLTKFDNALDIAFNKGYQVEKLFQPARMVGDILITYALMCECTRSNECGCVLVMMKLQGANCEVSFNRPVSRDAGSIEKIPTLEFLSLPDVD